MGGTRARKVARATLRLAQPDYAVLPARKVLDPRARRLAKALGRKTTGEEQAWITRIETLRREVEQSPQEVGDRKSDVRTVGTIARRASQAPATAALLMKVVHDFRPRFGVELGTCVGISCAYQAAAMMLAGGGRFVTLEGSETLCSVAERNLASLGLGGIVEVRHGTFRSTLGGVLPEDTPDYGFIDGHHAEDATLEYHEAFLSAASGMCVLVFDDIDWSDGMRRAWQHIREHPRTDLAVAVGRLGFTLVTPR
jgi:predicted O-methyltransferase YrrM